MSKPAADAATAESDGFNVTIHAPLRLRICAMLAAADQIEFGLVQERLGVSASVLSKHVSSALRTQRRVLRLFPLQQMRASMLAMTARRSPNVEVIDLAPGLWIWRLEHPEWNEDHDWQEVVTTVCVDAGAERWLIDPLLPPDDATQVWDRFAERPPTAVAVLIPDHLRETWSDRQTWSVDALVCRYGCRAFGPNAFDPDMVERLGPVETEVQKIRPGQELPGGLVPFRDPRGWDETPLYLPQHKTLVFGDSLTERDGSLRVWMSPTHEERALPDLRAMLDIPFERVIISHGEPVHTREAFEGALEQPQWPASPLHLAAWRGDLEQVRARVESGADLTARDERYGTTPLEWAKGGGHDVVIVYLESVTSG